MQALDEKVFSPSLHGCAKDIRIFINRLKKIRHGDNTRMSNTCIVFDAVIDVHDWIKYPSM